MKQALEALLEKAPDRAEAVAKLKKSQIAWEAYRDAQLETSWPFADRTWYGSVHPMCVAGARAALTEARTRELKAMIVSQEGDVCSSRWPE